MLIGYKTKIVSCALIVLLLIENILFNAFWMVTAFTSLWDFKTYVRFVGKYRLALGFFLTFESLSCLFLRYSFPLLCF